METKLKSQPVKTVADDDEVQEVPFSLNMPDTKAVQDKANEVDPEPMLTERGRNAEAKDTLVSAREVELQDIKAEIKSSTTTSDTKSAKDEPRDAAAAAGKRPPPADRISFFKLFKYADCTQKALVYLGVLSAIIGGASAPSIALVFGEIVAIFDPNNSSEEVEEGIIKLFKLIGILSAVLWVFGYLQYACLQSAAERLSFDLRTLYLKQLLKQETEFFERQQVESLPAQIAEYFQAIGEGVGEKVGQLVYAIAMFIGGLSIAFYQGPIFTLICLCYMPLMIAVIAFFGGLVGKKMKDKLAQTKKLGAHTEETLSALKLVVSFAQEDHAVKKYDEIASESKDLASKASVF